MGKLTDIQIRAWIKSGERFVGRADGDGLYLRFREGDASASWRYRYRFDGKQRVMNLGGGGLWHRVTCQGTRNRQVSSCPSCPWA